MDSKLFTTQNEFQNRHIGPSENEKNEMLKFLGFNSISELTQKVIPKNIISKKPFHLGEGIAESDMLTQAKTIFSHNHIFKTYIGMGYYDTHTPPVIQRNVLENPNWYTAYTPYQAEIAQGRLESLLNFQTMVADLTGLEISNASLLDEGTAAAEAMAMAQSLASNKSETFFASDELHPHILEVLKTRADGFGFKMQIGNVETLSQNVKYFALILSYPTTWGDIKDYQKLTADFQAQGGLVLVDTDLLALTILPPPGEWGADIAFGNSQRFGVPLGFGGPHAAFLATRDKFKRSMPGRIVGVSVDRFGNRALRLALQTREQHIRREKATSNICTAQVLLAHMASFYAIYHGPKGLKQIAERVSAMASILRAGLDKMGIKILNSGLVFDTICLQPVDIESVKQKTEKMKLNFRYSEDKVGISLDETTTLTDIDKILHCLSPKSAVGFTAQQLASEYKSHNLKSRKSEFLTHSVFNSYHSETELMRYIQKLCSKDITLTHSMIPLGSCTMKLNSASELMPVSWSENAKLHPFAPADQTLGSLELIKDLEAKLCDITGFAAVTLQPNAGSQGEYAGLMVIRKYFSDRGESHRKICLIPSSAHGTNPASAVMAGFEVVVVQCDSQGNVDIADLNQKVSKHSSNLGALMITYPSTHGVFEESIVEICEIIHKNGGQVYMDGANLNALVGICRPGEYGPDVSHMNLHKTFAIPHGGGGPGVGPIGVAKHLAPFLPSHIERQECGTDKGITAVSSAPWGSASILPIPWAYISMMGSEGLKHATEVAILNANYIAKKLEPHFPILYKGVEGLVAHECIIDLRPLKKSSGIDVVDVAKRLMDFGFHAPTMSFPVAGTLMIEPTESESKGELDRFIDAMICIRQEISKVENGQWTLQDNPLVFAPHTIAEVSGSEWTHAYSRETAAFPMKWLKENKNWPTVARIDNAYGDKNLICSCLPISEYT